MPIEEKINKLKSQFASLQNWEEKYEKLIELGKKWPGLPDDLKIEDLKVKGCQSQVWIKAEMTPDKKIKFRGDSDALLVRGLVAIVLSVYSDETPQTILSTDPVFLKEMGFDAGLSPSRSNGLYSMIKQVKYYATAFQYLLSK
jgi:cysteine desulfuration protein SufE